MSDFVDVLAPRAESDIADTLAWYRARNALAADAFKDEVFGAIDRIAMTPLSRPADDEGNRKRLLHHFP